MIVIKVNYTTDAPIIKVNYDDSPIYITTTVDATYIKVDYGSGGGGASVWGQITGTLSDQTDLQDALDDKVPYTGATGDVDLGEHGLSGGYIEFDTTPTGTPATQGTMYWDDSHSTVALIMNGTIQHIGQDSYYYVKNSSGSSIAKGTAVRFAGTDGASGHLLIEPFLANGTYPSDYFMGVTSETIANGSFGQVTHFGEIEGINTSAYNAGDLLYASTSVAGGYQTTAPVAPNNIILVAAVLNSKNNGIIVVRPTIGSNINKDEGVLFTSKTDKDVIYYDAPTTLFKNASISSILGYTPGTVTSVALSVPTGLVITSGSPITSSGTIAVGLQSGYSIPTTIKQGNWDDAYTFVSGFPSQSGNNGKYLTTDGSTLSWANIVSGVSSFNTRTGAVTLTLTDVTDALGYIPANSSDFSAKLFNYYNFI